MNFSVWTTKETLVGKIYFQEKVARRKIDAVKDIERWWLLVWSRSPEPGKDYKKYKERRKVKTEPMVKEGKASSSRWYVFA